VPVRGDERSLEARKIALRASPDVRFAGGVLVDPNTNEPVLYTENLFINSLIQRTTTIVSRCCVKLG